MALNNSFLPLVFLLGCWSWLNAQKLQEHLEKFEPPQGTCLVFIGQDMEAVGGLEGYQGYCDRFSAPAGITVYTNLSPGTNSFGHTNVGLDGLTTTANWGSGDSCAACYLEDDTFNESMLSIGLSMVGNEKKVANGQHDTLIIQLANWIKAAQRPIFLRIGYEFDGWSWNHYNRRHYLKAWKRIHKIFDQQEVHNVAYVWQSKGSGSNSKVLEVWYPGDAIVDWCAYSYFGNPDTAMLQFARIHKKPVFIAEASPVLQDGSLYFNSDLKDGRLAKNVWKQWFVPFFKTVENYQDVIKAIGYINTNWPSQPMWTNNPTFAKVDSRIQVSPYVSKKWQDQMDKPRYLHASKALWEQLGVEE